MEETADGTPLPDADQDSRYTAVVRHTRPQAEATTTSGANRRYSLADFTDLRRRDTATNHLAGTQFRGLVIPSPAVGGSDTTKSSMCFLPTITGTKPQSKLQLTSSTQERRGSSGYQSVLTGPPFISTSLSNAGGTASNVQRRSSIGYPFLQHSSTSSFTTSLIEPSGVSQCVTNVSGGGDEDVGDANDPDLLQQADEFDNSKSRRTVVNTDSTGASDEVPTQVHSVPPDNGDEEPADGRLLSPEVSSQSTAGEHEVSQGPSTTESLKLDSLKIGKDHEEQTEIVVNTGNADIEEVTRSCRSGGVDVDRCTLPTSNSKLSMPECPPESRDHSVVSSIAALQIRSKNVNDNDSRVRSSADWRDTPSNTARDKTAAGTAMEIDSRNWESFSKTSSGRQRSPVDGEFNRDAIDTATKSITRPDSGSITNVIINKGNLGLGFCIAGGRGSMTGDNRIVVKRIFKGNFHDVIDIQTCIGTGNTAGSVAE